MWAHGAPIKILQGNYVLAPGLSTRQFDVTADGKRFIMVKAPPTDVNRGPSIIVVQHWIEELKRLVPMN